MTTTVLFPPTSVLFQVGQLANIEITLWPFLFLAVMNVATMALVGGAKYVFIFLGNCD